MDGLSEDSPLLPAVLIADFIDRLIEHWLSSLLTAFAVSTYFFFLGGKPDAWLALGFVALKHSSAIASLSYYINLKQIGYISGITLGTCLLGCYMLRWVFSRKIDTKTGVARPMLVPSRTTHIRHFPKKHSFSYSYLIVGTPVDFSGNANGMVSANSSSSSSWFSYLFESRGWFDVNPVDYLQRGYSDNGLRGKVDAYLKSEGIDPLQYPYAYLVTAARFMGYHFNPASFWFLYSPDKVLSAVIVEMNNIFGERRPYLIARDFEAEAKHLQDQSHNDEVRELHCAAVKATWRKDFHVSPFNSRKGSYSLLASDPLGPEMQCFRGLDVTINLSSSKGFPKLTAKLFSEGEALDPYELSIVQKARFILSWFWVGSVTYARFAKDSATLFYNRKLHVWYRPEPLKDSMGRPADDTEKVLEDVFRKYLRHLVEKSSAPIVVRYIPSGAFEASEESFTSHLASESTHPSNEIKIKVLTPVFYSRFVHYAHDSEALFCELAESCTIWTDKPEFLTNIFLKKASPPLHASNLVDYICFQLIKNLRRRPSKIERPLTSADKPSPPTKGVDIRDFRMSSMDAFVLGQEDVSLKKAYRTMVVRLFVADRIVFGSTGLLGTMELVGRGGVSWVLASLVTQAIQGFS